MKKDIRTAFYVNVSKLRGVDDYNFDMNGVVVVDSFLGKTIIDPAEGTTHFYDNDDDPKDLFGEDVALLPLPRDES